MLNRSQQTPQWAKLSDAFNIEPTHFVCTFLTPKHGFTNQICEHLSQEWRVLECIEGQRDALPSPEEASTTWIKLNPVHKKEITCLIEHASAIVTNIPKWQKIGHFFQTPTLLLTEDENVEGLIAPSDESLIQSALERLFDWKLRSTTESTSPLESQTKRASPTPHQRPSLLDH